MDDELSPRARMLVDVALEADQPPPAVADGSWELVVSRLTIEAARAPRPEPTVAPERTLARWVVFVVIGMVIVATVALAWMLGRPRPDLGDAKAPVPARAPVVHPPAHAPVAPPPATMPAHADADGSALLDLAERAEPAHALELLTRHAEQTPLGPDSERRMAMRIAVLCELGRTDDAKAETVAFLGRPRDAKWTAKVEGTCGAR